MTNRETDTRACTLVDIPFIRRISDTATVLDTELELTRDMHGPGGTILSSLLLPQRGQMMLLARVEETQVVGQFRIRRALEPVAQMVYIAPTAAPDGDDTAWLHLLDAMAREAGKLHASALMAEVDEDSLLFEVMRHSGFSVYARQQVWRRLPGDYPCLEPPVRLRDAVETDLSAIQSLVTRVVPKMLHPLITPVEHHAGLVYEEDGLVQAFVSVTEGKHGLYLVPYVDQTAMDQLPAIVHQSVESLQKAETLPVYIRVRRYQEWIVPTLEALQFQPGPPQAMMVRHIKATVRQPRYNLARQGLKVIPSVIVLNEQESKGPYGTTHNR